MMSMPLVMEFFQSIAGYSANHDGDLPEDVAEMASELHTEIVAALPCYLSYPLSDLLMGCLEYAINHNVEAVLCPSCQARATRAAWSDDGET